MKTRFAQFVASCLVLVSSSGRVLAQCDDILNNGPNTSATSCACASGGQTDCDLLPDIMISWYGLANTSSGPSEYAQTATSNAGRLRISGVTPNVGMGPLEVRGVRADGYRKFLCGTEVDSVYSPTANNVGFTCPNGFNAKQILYQRIYHKNGNTMSFNEYERGTMTYHPTHAHYHVNGWTTMTLRLAQPGVSDPLQWPILATGGKLGFCLTNLFTCQSSPNYCKDSNLYGQGTNFPSTYWGNNYALGTEPGCSDDVQSIVVGKGDIYDETLDGMWLNLLPGLCNGQYHIVAQADPANDFIESNEANNWTSIPFTLTQQTTANNGGTANIQCSGRTVLGAGQTRTLTASPGTAYSWSTGATSRSITVGVAGTYSCTVSCPCGSLSTPSLTLTFLSAPSAPSATGATIQGPGQATLGASGSGTELAWYDAFTGGTQLGTGSSYTTPMISNTTNYWVEARNISAGQALTVGRTANTTQGAYLSEKQWLLFDVTTPFRLHAFKVNASGVGQRHFVLVDRLGNMIGEKYIELPNGSNTVVVDWDVPAGLQYKISAFDDNTEVIRNLWYNNAGVSYPYPIGTLGSITGSTGGSANYYYLYDWEVTTDAVVSASVRTQATATVVNSVALSLKVKLDGPYNVGSGLMSDALRVAALIPQGEPYTAAGMSQVAGGGGETLAPGVLNVTGNNAIVDWVRVELRSSSSPGTIVATRQALLQCDGDVVATDGVSPISLGIGTGNYYVVLRHRNHLGCMTSSAIALSTSPFSLDLSSATTSTWGTNARKSVSGQLVLWAGNAFMDGQVKYTGSANDRDPILLGVGSTVPTNTVAGYQPIDVNLDGVVKYTGTGNDRDPILVNVGGTTPNNVITEQIP